MLNYIKQQLSAKNAQPDVVQQEHQTFDDIPDEAVLEYAHLFQELDDLTLEGSEYGKERKLGAVSIPLEDDVEAETIEINLGDNLVYVPGDATVSTVTESYEGMKTYEQFYQEAAKQVTRFARETDSAYDARITERADAMYQEYCAEAKELGYFGFANIDLDDERVPSKINVDLGPITKDSNKSFVSKLKTFFATDSNHQITKKQLDSVNLVKNGAFSKIGEPLMAYMESNYNVPSGSSVWDVCTPTSLVIPRGNADSFCVVLEYMNELTNEKEYFGWTMPVTKDDTVQESTVIVDECERINMESFVTDTQYENKDAYMKYIEEELNNRRERMSRVKYDRFYQEAIDFGGGDGGSDLPAADSGNSEPPAMDSDTANSDQNVDTGNSSDAPEANDDSTGDKEIAAVNDVSSQIADNVAQATQNDNTSTGNTEGGEGNETITFDDEPTSTDTTDTTGDDLGADNVDDQLDELNTEGLDNEEGEEDSSALDSMGDDGMVDIENMTIDQLIEAGSEKLKAMPISEIKNFISTPSPELQQEAFFITNKTVNKEVDLRLRKCLGILNDNQNNVDAIFKQFKFAGHKLNKVLSKASKMTKVYSSDEIGDIKKLNTALTTLLLSLKKKKAENYVSLIKKNIGEFTKQSKIVASFVEQKMNKPVAESYTMDGDAVVQEGLFLSAGNAKKRLGKKVPLVYADMSTIIKASDEGFLTKGKLSKMYKPRTEKRTSAYSAGSQGGFENSREREYEFNTVHSNYLDELSKIASKILRKEKVQRAFSREELSNITDLVDNIDDFVEAVEAVVYDSNDNTEIIKKIAEIAKKIIANLDIIISNTPGMVNDSSMKGISEDNPDMTTSDVDTNDDTSDDTTIPDSVLNGEDEGTDDNETESVDDTPDEEGGESTDSEDENDEGDEE